MSGLAYNINTNYFETVGRISLPKHKQKKITQPREQRGKISAKAAPTIKGKFIGNDRGFGFVEPDATTAEDIFISPSMTGGALHGDEVLCRLIVKKEEPAPKKKSRRMPKNQPKVTPTPPESTQRQTGQIIEITHRKSFIGTYYTVGQEGYVRPVGGKIPYVFSVSSKTRNRFGLADGHRVVFLVPKPKPGKEKAGARRDSKKTGNLPATNGHAYSSGEKDSVLTCSILEVIGHVHDPGVDVLTLVYQAGIPYQFPEDVTAQAASLPEEISADDLKGRLDLRNQHIITIDGEDTKDIDDAIHLTQTPDGHYQLGVHIADVSHYVKPGTPLDTEALNRGTSVYLADRVIPMLPHRLSSGICSLFPGVDRLALSCIMTVNAEGDVTAYEIVPSVINSKRRWTYKEVQDILDAATDTTTVPVESTNLFQAMNRLREILSQKRHKRGALDFNLPEAKIKVDETGHPISIEPYERTKSTGIIEEFMILANETIAAHCQNHNIPLIYRAHDTPAQEKYAMLAGLAKSMGFTMPPHSSGPKAIQQMLELAESTPAYQALAMAALTSLPQAVYTPTSPKHFGLASDAYCHFTSPIRRYADLQVHRIIKETANSTAVGAAPCRPQGDRTLNHNDTPNLTAISAQCSSTEREAETLEREVAQLKKVQFMLDQEGKIFDGTISGITPWGVYVMLPNTIEGLLPSQHLKHHGFTHEKDKNRYTSKPKRETLLMGASISVRLSSANEEERKLTFSLC